MAVLFFLLLKCRLRWKTLSKNTHPAGLNLLQFSGTTAMELKGLPSKRMVEVAQ